MHQKVGFAYQRLTFWPRWSAWDMNSKLSSISGVGSLLTRRSPCVIVTRTLKLDEETLHDQNRGNAARRADAPLETLRTGRSHPCGRRVWAGRIVSGTALGRCAPTPVERAV